MFYNYLSWMAVVVLLGVATVCFIGAYKEFDKGENKEALTSIGSGLIFLGVALLYIFLSQG